MKGGPHAYSFPTKAPMAASEELEVPVEVEQGMVEAASGEAAR